MAAARLRVSVATPDGLNRSRNRFGGAGSAVGLGNGSRSRAGDGAGRSQRRRSCPIAACARSTASSAARTRSPTCLSFPARTGARGFLGDIVIAVGRREAAGARRPAIPCKPSCACWRCTVCYTCLATITRPTMAQMARVEARLRKKAGLKEGLIERRATTRRLRTRDPTAVVPPGMCRDLPRHRLSGVQCADAAVAAHPRRAHRSRRCARAVPRGSAPPLHSGAPADQHADDPCGGAAGARHRASIAPGFPVLVLSIIGVVLACEHLIPLLIVRQDPERVLDVLLPSFDVDRAAC